MHEHQLGLTREFKESAKAGSKDLFTGVTDIPPIEVQQDLRQFLGRIDEIRLRRRHSAATHAEIHMLTTGEDMAKPRTTGT